MPSTPNPGRPSSRARPTSRSCSEDSVKPMPRLTVEIEEAPERNVHGKKFVKLFGTKTSRIEFVNRTAGQSFRIVESSSFIPSGRWRQCGHRARPGHPVSPVNARTRTFLRPSSGVSHAELGRPLPPGDPADDYR
jgi:hypothetical protein